MVGQHSCQLEPIERASADELRALQLTRLRHCLQHTYEHVGPYRAKCERAGVHPQDLRTLEDLRHFPFTVKDDLREHYPFGMLAVPRTQVVRVHASSGTTGKATVVAYTRADIDTWAALVARSIRAAGGKKGDAVHVAYGYGLFTGGLGAHYGAEYLGCTVIPMSGGQTQKQVQLICDLRPDIIMVTPSYMLAIAEEFVRQGHDPGATSLRVGIFGAEPWSEAMRTQIEARMHIDAVDIYGLSEVMGPGVASECVESKDGPVIWEDHFYPEVIDPVSEAVLPPGAHGELVLTTLTKEALPLIRYRTGDLVSITFDPCECGRTTIRLMELRGRRDDMLIVRGVNVFPSQVEHVLLGVEGVAPHYRLIVERTGAMDELTLECEPAQDADADDLAARIGNQLREHMGIRFEIVVREPGSIPRSEGKAVRVVDRRGG